MKSLSRRQFTQQSSKAIFGLASANPFMESFFKRTRIKIGQIGTAHPHAEEKMETLQRRSDIFKVAGIVENDKARKQKAQSEASYQKLAWLTEDQLLNTPGLKAVLIETELDELVPTALRCIEQGLHVHVDKPPGKSLEELRQLFDKAEENKMVVQMGYMFRYHPAFQFCLNAVHEGWLGQIFEIDAVISKAINPKRRPELAKTYGGGMLLLGCHLIDIAIALCGMPEKVTSYRRQTFPEQDELFDNEVAIFEYPKTIATVKSSLIEVDGEERRQFVVCAEKGTIEIKPLEPPQLRMTLSDPVDNFPKGRQSVELPAMTGRYDEQLIDFAQMIWGEKESVFSWEHDLRVQETLLKASEMF